VIDLRKLLEIPAGPALLGLPECPSDFPSAHRWPSAREVAVPAFQIAKFAVTRQEYETFLDTTGHPPPVDWDDPLLKNPRLPVCGVSWEDGRAYCRWLSQASGKPFRLPNADEWEKAARGGLVGKRFPWGDEDPKGRCCFGQPPESAPVPVGSFPPNGYGLYDMVGNAWEWLAELYKEVAADPPVNTPTGHSPEVNRVLVGGSFMTEDARFLWVAYRHEDPPDLRHRCLGFRVAQ